MNKSLCKALLTIILTLEKDIRQGLTNTGNKVSTLESMMAKDHLKYQDSKIIPVEVTKLGSIVSLIKMIELHSLEELELRNRMHFLQVITTLKTRKRTMRIYFRAKTMAIFLCQKASQNQNQIINNLY